ncbi:MAG: hypothetical protein A2X36_05505 [Elusimicrobia bacterium GWA2_69_24]|nr:MAG: hypothetical protein A2X36_05505 [Elusimicrobia bacterium GWA2_69_24]
MSFGWNAWSPVNLGIDLAVLVFSAIVQWRTVAARHPGGFPPAPSWGAVATLSRVAILALAPWVLGAVFLGGILGLCLLSRVMWITATVGVPLAGLYLMAKWRKPWLSALLILPLGLKYYGEVWEPNNLEIERVRIALPRLRDPVRLVHLSDLQTDDIRPMHLAVRAAANEFDPDFIAFTGDVLNHRSLIPEVAEYLRGFRHRRGAFFVTGNVDGILPLASFCAQAGFEPLDGTVRVRPVGRSRVAFLGLGIADALDKALLGRLVEKAQDADVRILLDHLPDALYIARSTTVDLLLAGHTHGGQVVTPFGPLLTLSRVPRRIAAGGLHRVDGLRVIVSRGLGLEGHIAPRLRTFARPHLLLVELVPEPTSD